MKLQQGIRRLVLIQSGSHRFSDFPLDKPLSIHGRNNLGKSQTINALQFLFFRAVSEMDFGDYASSQSKEFYFKSEYSMIVTEIMVSEGVFLFGAAGKGPLHSYEYEHFLIKSPFNKKDFMEDGKHLKAKEIFNRFEKNGLTVYKLNRDQLKHALTGNHFSAGIPYDVTLVPIREVTDLRFNVFKNIYKNLLTMRKMSDREIKGLVLEVFANVLANTKVDFIKVKAEAFRDHDNLSGEIATLEKIQFNVDKMLREYNNRNTSKEALIEIKTRLIQLSSLRQKAIPLEKEKLASDLREMEQFLKNAQDIHDDVVRSKELASQELAHARSGLALIEDGRAKFGLLSMMGSNDPTVHLKMMQDSIDLLHDERARLTRSIGKTSGKTPLSIQRQIASHEKAVERLCSELESVTKRDTWINTYGLNGAQRQQLSRVFNPGFMSLDSKSLINQGGEDTSGIIRLCSDLEDNNQITLNGVLINIEKLKTAAYEREPEDVSNEIKSLQSLIDDLKAELVVVTDTESANNKLGIIISTIQRETDERESYRQHLLNCEREQFFRDQLSVSSAKFDEHSQQLRNYFGTINQSNERVAILKSQIKRLDQELLTLNEMSKEAFYQDHSISLSEEQYVSEDTIVDVEDIEAYLRDAKGQYGKYIASSAELSNLIEMVNAVYSKHSGEETQDEFIRKVKDERNSLPEKYNMLENLHHEAIIKMASALDTLNKNYIRLESQINDFNRKVNGKKVSNLKSFKLKLIPNIRALDSIKTILSSQVESNSVLDMFSNANKDPIDQTVHNDAVNYLSAMVSEINGSLTLADLFELGFEIIDANNKESTYTSLDGHASNGTTMTMKALFNMNLLRYLYDTRAQTVHLPFYVDEATNIDDANRLSLIAMSHDLGFVPVFASVDPIITATYGINLEEAATPDGLIVPEEAWMRYLDKELSKPENQMDLLV
ncbi:hypothetical protein ACI2KR_07870 [Pseudomonas luteola]